MFFLFWYFFIYFQYLIMMPVSRNCVNDIDTVWQNILNCVREIAFFSWDRITIEVSTISDEFLPNSSPPPFYPWECSEFSLLDFVHSKFTFYCLCEVKILIITITILFSLLWSTIVWMQPDQNLPCFWFFALLLLLCHILFCMNLQLSYLLNSWSRLHFIWQSSLLGQTWKSLDC